MSVLANASRGRTGRRSHALVAADEFASQPFVSLHIVVPMARRDVPSPCCAVHRMWPRAAAALCAICVPHKVRTARVLRTAPVVGGIS